ncbi:MAG: AzlD domain-containing protein [Chitinophagaceae bacterium]|nr:AzlD domain-containing protein [Anaerolineae bacterium]
MKEALLILGMMIVTFGVRYPVLALVGRIELPEPVIRALRYVPPAVLTAIIVPAVLLRDGQIALTLDNAYLIGAIAAIGVAWRTRNLLWAIVLGMGVFLLWRVLTGGL